MDLELGLVVASEVDGSHGDGDGGGDGVRVTFWHSVKKEVGPGKRKIRDSDVKIKIYIFILINSLIYLFKWISVGNVAVYYREMSGSRI